MQGNFTFQNSTRLHFGKEALNKLRDELQNYGPKVMLTYGGASAADLENYADACPINESGYVVLTRQDVIDVLRARL